ncbi:hypothetical protein DSBG_3338 [Desulfosporosinus sp. BG]|nr:hypothetical protein DSBG_3338 [Desulfosporosinus sp. BG]
MISRHQCTAELKILALLISEKAIMTIMVINNTIQEYY